MKRFFRDAVMYIVGKTGLEKGSTEKDEEKMTGRCVGDRCLGCRDAMKNFVIRED